MTLVRTARALCVVGGGGGATMKGNSHKHILSPRRIPLACTPIALKPNMPPLFSKPLNLRNQTPPNKKRSPEVGWLQHKCSRDQYPESISAASPLRTSLRPTPHRFPALLCRQAQEPVCISKRPDCC